MKKIASIMLFMAAMFSGNAGAQSALRAVFGYSTFYSAQTGQPYVETYLSFDAWTMNFVEQANGSYRATAEVVIVARQGDSVCYVKKYDLNSPTVGSLEELDFSFIDMQRFSLKNGIYDLELTIGDKNSPEPAATVNEKLVLNYDDVHPTLSSVQFMAGATPTTTENIFSRGGYDMEPYVSDFLPEQVSQLNFYYEIYNINQELGKKPFLAVAYVEQQETGNRFESQRSMSRKYSAAYVPVYGSLDISQLPSGNYNLVVELRNSDNQLLLYKKMPFYRSNPGVKGEKLSDFAGTFAGAYIDEEQLNIYLDALYPIASEHEKDVARDLIKRPGLEEKQAFLYRFWQERYPLNPEVEWLKYKERIDYVQATFSYPRTPGIHTDRGRVYLQYGPPDFVRDEKNFVSVRNLNGTHSGTPVSMRQTGNDVDQNQFATESQGHIYYLPYQIWRYNKLPMDDNTRVFLFWDEHRSGFYTLLNSNARGEVQDPGWERRLCRNQLGDNVIGEVGQQFQRGY